MRRPCSIICSLMLSGHCTILIVNVSPSWTVQSELRELHEKYEVMIYSGSFKVCLPKILHAVIHNQ